MHVPEAECPVVHLGQHPRFVRRIDIAVVVVDEHVPCLSCGRLHIDVPRPMRGQDFREKNLRVHFSDAVAAPIHLEDVREALSCRTQESVPSRTRCDGGF